MGAATPSAETTTVEPSIFAGEDKNFVPAQAKIEGSTVVVSAEGVAAPKAVRYGWANVPDVNLFNQEGLPASPFRTDVD